MTKHSDKATLALVFGLVLGAVYLRFGPVSALALGLGTAFSALAAFGLALLLAQSR
jgi:hypothetical protein